MKLIAIPTRDSMVDDHFGHCAYYTVVTLDEQNQVVKQERLNSPEGCGCKSNIASVMQEMGITLMLGKVDDVLNAYLNGELKDSLESCDHHDCDHHQEKPVYFVPSFGKK